MNRDDILRLYEKANGWRPDGFERTVQELERFAALVEAAEREACAQMAEAFHRHQYDFTGDLELHEAIRARGQK